MKKLIFALLATTIITACSNNSGKTEDTEAYSTWTKFEHPEYKYTILYPEDWTTTKKMSIDLFHPKNQMDTRTKGSVNVVVEEIGTDMSSAEYAEASLKNIESAMKVSDVAHKQGKIGDTDAEVITYKMQGDGFNASILQYCLTHNKRGYVVTTAHYSDDSNNSSNSGTADSIANTFKLVD